MSSAVHHRQHAVPETVSPDNRLTSTEAPIIVGAGPVGAICALAMQHHGIVPSVLEARTKERTHDDARTLVLSHGSRLILERLEVWSRLNAVTPITRIHISQRGGFGTTRLSAHEEGLPALGYVVSYGALEIALEAALDAAAIPVRYGIEVQRVESRSVYTAQGEQISSPLIVVADGGRGEQAPSPRLARDYEQIAIVCEVQTELPHRQLAYERFTPDGPVALLPHDHGVMPGAAAPTRAAGHTYALVWSVPPSDAERIATLDDAAFLAALYAHFGGRQGRFVAVTPRKRFPLKLSFIGTQAHAGVVRIGNAAQTLHPVSGQGFNIGMRDAWELAALCGDTPAEAMGNAAMLRTYMQTRRMDVLGGMGFTDFLVRAFSNDFAPLRQARGLGLLALELLPPLKHFVARRMIFGSRG